MAEAFPQPKAQLVDFVGADLELSRQVLAVAFAEARLIVAIPLDGNPGRGERGEEVGNFPLALGGEDVDVVLGLVAVEARVLEGP